MRAAEGGRRHRGLLIGLALLVLLAGGGFAAWRTGFATDVWDAAPFSSTPSAEVPTGSVAPSAAESPGLELAPVPPAAAVAEPAARGRLTPRPAALSRVLEAALEDRHLGRHVLAQVGDLDGGPAVSVGTGATAMPASTTKLLTTAAALEVLGPDHVFTTTVVSGAGRRIVLVGGGDPHLMSHPVRTADRGHAYPPRADLRTLAADTAQALKAEGRSSVRLGYDAGLFSGPAYAASWKPDYAADDVVAPIGALWVDEGRPASGYGRVADPAAYAARLFARQLIARGIKVLASPAPVTAPDDAPTLATAVSAPLDQIVERILEVSDNEAAEVIGHQVGVAVAQDGSFDGGVRGVLTTLRGLGIPLAGARLFDGSGLSRADRLAPRTLLAVLRAAASEQHPELRAVITGLPVAGFTGSLAFRFDQGSVDARGVVRAKTGTLTGVSALAGLATDADGNQLVFVLVADRVRVRDTLTARVALDEAAAALATCHCSR